MLTAQDSRWMAQALRLAELGLYGTSPNPRVGCVVVKGEQVVGYGWHQRAGEPHAEVHALVEAGASARGATAYVTLEPCSHHGRTPPCADALIAASVARVVVAVEDPNPKVAGQGIAKLRAAGISVDCGLMHAEARELNAGFFARMQRGMPWVRSKIAMSLDGRTALANGASKWITCEEARKDVQRWRARCCAVMTGIGTILADDPQLSVRDVETRRQPLRVVLDSRLRMPLSARVLDGGNVLVYAAERNIEKISALQSAGCNVQLLPDGEGRIDLNAMLRDLALRGCNEVLIEAGSILNGAMLGDGFVDELLLYVAPSMLGDVARGVAQLGNLTSLDERTSLEWKDIRQIGPDLRIQARIQK
jgi:diaminohydroxyphosphoribosylaminopyrimidine deaminase/5-amino-6-(5-phosphoribosylamino)uracil reductase